MTVHAIVASIVTVVCEAFQVHPKASRSLPFSTHRISTNTIPHRQFMIPPPTEFTVPSSEFVSSLTLAAEEASWRQYFSLLLIGGVLIDIVLGSPLANMALKPLRGDNNNELDDEDSNNKNQSRNNSNNNNRSRERIDSDAVAKAAIERAQNALELRRFLDERKTDWDRMEDMKRKLDAEMQELDADLKAREESFKRNQSK